MRKLNHRVAFGCFTVCAACSGSTTDPRAAPVGPGRSSVTLTSDAGDFVGAGRSYAYTRADAVLVVDGFGNRLAVTVQGDEYWSGTFQLPSTVSRLTPGTYPGLTRYPLNNSATGGIEWAGEGRACKGVTGTVTVDAATYTDGVLTGIDLRFEQHCDGAAAALRGNVHWRVADSTLGPGPTAVPSDLWRPPAGAVPGTGDYVFLQSEPGDEVAGGETVLYTAPVGPVVAGREALARVSVGAWDGRFQGMNSVTRLQPGFYPNLKGWGNHNPARGGLSWYGGLHSCTTITGWFAVDRVSYAGDALAGITLRFEQHCDGAAAALRGAVRWGT